MRIHLPGTASPDTIFQTEHGKIISPGQILPKREFDVDPEEIRQLVEAARAASANAYAPFSKFRVGAALKMADDRESDRTFVGSNVENSSYGATNCAERTALFQASSVGLRTLRMVVVTTVDSLYEPLAGRSPCGICRQVIKEFSNAQTLIVIDSGSEDVLGEVLDIDRLLPWGFHFGDERG